MIKQVMNYRVEPMIFLDGKKTSFKIIPRGKHAWFDDSKEYVVMMFPLDETIEGTNNMYDHQVLKPQNGVFEIQYTFHGTQEYFIRIFNNETFNSAEIKDKDALLRLSVYVLNEQLFELRPYRGDFHCHSTGSDGNEAPEFVAANYRKAGYDFFALTDHRAYSPSIEAIEAYKNLPIDLKIFPGEEVHSPDNHVHIVNFGGKHSVNEIFQKDKATYYNEVAQIEKDLKLPSTINKFEYAACIWVFRKIKEASGLSIYCHPHWCPTVRHINQEFTDCMFAEKPFDAFELLGGHECIYNNTQVAMYYELALKGIRVPIVGSSDAHSTADGVTNFKEESTIVFAKNLQLDRIIEAVTNFNSVAVEQYNREQQRVYGPFQLVKYTQFLMENYFPIHDEMCFEEGRLMLEAKLNSENAVELLKLMQGRVSRYLEKCFAPK